MDGFGLRRKGRPLRVNNDHGRLHSAAMFHKSTQLAKVKSHGYLLFTIKSVY